MKNILFLVLLFNVQLTLSAQSDNLQWFTDLEIAKMAADSNQSKILMVFAGSDWCKPCIQFKKDILEAADFQAATKNELVILYLDFPARKKNKLSDDQTTHNEALAERFNKSGVFPNIFLIDAKENVLANPKFVQQSAAEFVAELQKIETIHN